MTTRLLTLRDVTAMTALSRSAIYALMAESRFPKPIRVGASRGPVGRAGSGRLHRQPAPRRLRAPGRAAETTCPTVCNGSDGRVWTGDTFSVSSVQNQIARWANTHAAAIDAIEIIANLIYTSQTLDKVARVGREADDAR